MNDSPLVSVLMTVYNREKYIAEAIQSVINSTYQNWELIIVDDRSKDKSVEIARTFEVKEERIKVYINEKNLGDYPNRNQAASYARGKYLKYVDADDMIYRYALEQMVYYMEKYNSAGYGLCALPQDIDQPFPILLNPKEAYDWNYNRYSLFHKSPLGAIINREAFVSIGGFSGKQHLGDFELWLRLSQSFNLLLMDISIGWYRVHDDQQMNDNRTDVFVPFKYLLVEKDLIHSKKCPLEPTSKEKVISNLNSRILRDIVASIRLLSLSKTIQLIKASNTSYLKLLRYVFTHFKISFKLSHK